MKFKNNCKKKICHSQKFKIKLRKKMKINLLTKNKIMKKTKIIFKIILNINLNLSRMIEKFQACNLKITTNQKII